MGAGRAPAHYLRLNNCKLRSANSRPQRFRERSYPLRSLIIGVLAFTMAMLGAACGGERPVPEQREHPRVDPSVLAAQTSGYQRQALADGVVTFAEYERAVLATIDCLKAGGLTVEGPTPRNNGRLLDFSFGAERKPGESPADADTRILQISNKCDDEFRLDIDKVWTQQNLLTPAQRDVQRAQLIECLRDAGSDIAVDADEEEVFKAAIEDRDSEGVRECRQRYPDFFLLGVK